MIPHMETKVVNQSLFWLVCLIWTCDAEAQVKSDPDEVASLVELLEDDGVPDPRPFRREQLALTRDAGTIVPVRGNWKLPPDNSPFATTKTNRCSTTPPSLSASSSTCDVV